MIKLFPLKKNLIKALKIIIPMGIGIYLTWYFYSGLTPKEKEAIPVAFANANYFWVLLAVVVAWLGHFSRAYRWKFLMEPLGYKPKLASLYHATMIGYVLNFTIPRSGEVARPGFLAKKENLPFDKVFGTVVAERIIDVIMLLGIMFITGLMVGSDVIDDITKKFEVNATISNDFNSSNLKAIILEDSTTGYKVLTDLSNDLRKDYVITEVNGKSLEDESGLNYFEKNKGEQIKLKGWLPVKSNFWLYIILIGGFLVGAILLMIKKIRQFLIAKLMGMWDGVKTIFTMKKRIPFILHTLFIWATYILLMWFMAQGVEGMEGIGIKALMVGFVVGAVAIAITPGGIGLYPIFITAALVNYDFGKDLASGFSIMAWVIMTVFLVIAGIYSLYAIDIKFSNAEVEDQLNKEEN